MEGGRPERTDGMVRLEDGGAVVWVPEEMRFENDAVRVMVSGFLWAKSLFVASAVLPRPGCGG